MKLIDLLVKELPRMGGWPEGVADYKYYAGSAIAFDEYDREVHGFRLDIKISEKTASKVTREQYEAALAKNDGWIEWGGGECPVDLHEKLDVKYLGGGTNINVKAGGQMWSHARHFGDIIAYRQHKPDINSRANDARLEQDLNDCIGQDVDVVNHPSHYTKGNIECIDAIDSATTGKSGIEAVCVANIIKYLWRYEEKNGLEDVKKAQWYLNKLISEMESK